MIISILLSTGIYAKEYTIDTAVEVALTNNKEIKKENNSRNLCPYLLPIFFTIDLLPLSKLSRFSIGLLQVAWTKK